MKRPLPFIWPATACVALLVSGCAEQPGSPYPSLQPRPVESRSEAEPIEQTASAAAPDPALDARLAEYGKTLADAAAAFTPAADRAEQLAVAAKGDAPGGERWIAAQTALAELDGYRATTSSTLTDIEELAIARVADGLPAYPGIESTHAAGEAQLSAQTARISAIQAMLPTS